MFDPTKLLKVPEQSELYFWADYVEALCMTDADGHYSVDRLATARGFAADFGSTSPDAQDGDRSDVIDLLMAGAGAGDDRFEMFEDGHEDQDEGEGEDESETEDPVSATSPKGDAEADDRQREWCQTVFAYMKSREQMLGTSYPFEVDPRGMWIKRRELNDNTRLYVFLLCCSLLRCAPSAVQKLTSVFEVVSYYAMKQLVPSNAVVDLYGTARKHGIESRFKGTAFERLTGLAAELRGFVRARKAAFKKNDQGDNGLDVVAWVPMGDEADGVPAYFAQSACGQDWEAKQYEASYDRWRAYITMMSPPIKVTFIPFFFRDETGNWFMPEQISGVLIDRLRLILLIGSSEIPEPAVSLAQNGWDFELEVV